MKHIAVAGNIGAGKTTLATRLAQHYGWQASFESVDDNPYLADFYGDMNRWSFNLQIYFLSTRFNQLLDIAKNDIPTILDRTIYEDATIFARNLHDSGLMTDRDYKNYVEVFWLMTKFVPAPDVLLYLKADVPGLKARIKQRGRDYEKNIPDEYLQKLNTYYDDWIGQYSFGHVITIDISQTDLIESADDWAELLSRIDALKSA